MKTFINSFNAGEVSATFNESQLSGDLKALQYISVKRLENGIPSGHEGLMQRNGYNFLFLINSDERFRIFPLYIGEEKSYIIILENRLIIISTEYKRYYITFFPPANKIILDENLYCDDDRLRFIYITAGTGLFIYELTGSIAEAPIGSDILAKVNVDNTGLDIFNSLNISYQDVYFCLSASPSGTRVNPIIGVAVNPFTIDIFSQVFFDDRYDDILSGIYIPYNAQMKIGNFVNFDFTIKNKRSPVYSLNFNVKAKITQSIRCIKFLNKDGQKVIYANSSKPLDLKSPLSQQIFNIPETYTVELFFKLDFNLSELINNEENAGRLINSCIELGVPDVNIRKSSRGILNRKPFIDSHFLYFDNVLIESIADINTNVKIQITDPSIKNISTFASNSRLNIGYRNIWRTSKIGNYTDFIIKKILETSEPDLTQNDEIKAIDPLFLPLQNVTQIKWFINLKDRGVVAGTDAGIKLLPADATSFRLGIIDISNTPVSYVKPITCTINGNGGILFTNLERTNILFLSSLSTFETPIEDLTKYADFFLTDKIKKIVSVVFRAGEMTLVLTDAGKVFRLVTGNSDKFGWSREIFDIIKEYRNVESFPERGKNKIWYFDKSTKQYYIWKKDKYVQTAFKPIEVEDISTYLNQLIIVFGIDNIPNVKPVKVVTVLDTTNEITSDLWSTLLPFDYNFDMPDNVFINANQPNLPVYFIDQVDQSFKDAIVRPQQFTAVTHFNEYVGSNGNSKTLNRYIQDMIVNVKNAYGLEMGYKLFTRDNKEVEKTQEYIARTFQRIDDDLNPLVTLGNVKVPNSYQAEKIAITMRSANTLPVSIFSLTYNINFRQ